MVNGPKQIVLHFLYSFIFYIKFYIKNKIVIHCAWSVFKEGMDGMKNLVSILCFSRALMVYLPLYGLDIPDRILGKDVISEKYELANEIAAE